MFKAATRFCQNHTLSTAREYCSAGILPERLYVVLLLRRIRALLSLLVAKKESKKAVL